MEIIREKDSLGFYEIKLIKGDRTLTISFGGNGDLYWNLQNTENMDSKDEYFIINRSDGPIYDLFQKLYFRVSNHHIFQVNEVERAFCNSEEELKMLCEQKRKCNEELSNHPHFKALCNGKYVEWHSDNEPFETGNRLVMFLDYGTEEMTINISRVSREYDFLNVCFTHSGSRYSPFDMAFYEHYNELCEIDLTVALPSEEIVNGFDKDLGRKLRKTNPNNCQPEIK